MGIHRALLVANSKFYEDPAHLPELNAPIYDMSRLEKALTHPTIGVFDPGQVKLLPNARCADALLSIESFFLDCEPDDTLLLYYSGHGKLDINNNFFLCAADTRLDRLLSTAIRDEQVNAMMRSSPSGRNRRSSPRTPAHWAGSTSKMRFGSSLRMAAMP